MLSGAHAVKAGSCWDGTSPEDSAGCAQALQHGQAGRARWFDLHGAHLYFVTQSSPPEVVCYIGVVILLLMIIIAFIGYA